MFKVIPSKSESSASKFVVPKLRPLVTEVFDETGMTESKECPDQSSQTPTNLITVTESQPTFDFSSSKKTQGVGKKRPPPAGSTSASPHKIPRTDEHPDHENESTQFSDSSSSDEDSGGSLFKVSPPKSVIYSPETGVSLATVPSKMWMSEMSSLFGLSLQVPQTCFPIWLTMIYLNLSSGTLFGSFASGHELADRVARYEVGVRESLEIFFHCRGRFKTSW